MRAGHNQPADTQQLVRPEILFNQFRRRLEERDGILRQEAEKTGSTCQQHPSEHEHLDATGLARRFHWLSPVSGLGLVLVAIP